MGHEAREAVAAGAALRVIAPLAVLQVWDVEHGGVRRARDKSGVVGVHVAEFLPKGVQVVVAVDWSRSVRSNIELLVRHRDNG